jgi:hypothetical protein
MADTAHVSPAGELPLRSLLRVRAVAAQLAEELHGFVPDERGRERLARVHHRAVRKLGAVLPPPLAAELQTLRTVTLADDCTLGEIRVANAQLLGWLEGLLDSAVIEILTDDADALPQSARAAAGPARAGVARPVTGPDVGPW